MRSESYGSRIGSSCFYLDILGAGLWLLCDALDLLLKIMNYGGLHLATVSFSGSSQLQQ